MADEKPVKSPGAATAPTLDSARGSEGPALDMIRKLVALMEEHGLVEVEVEQENLAIRLRKGGAETPVVPAAVPAGPPAPARAAAPPAEAALPTINSPMVGTFYEAPSPEADPFVQVGDHVTEDSIVCVIEAMKVFNEIRAEMSGTIEKVLVKNSQAVEFGAPMFVVRPD